MLYTPEEQQKVLDLVKAIGFYSDYVTIFNVENARDTLQEKCDDLMDYIDLTNKGKSDVY